MRGGLPIVPRALLFFLFPVSQRHKEASAVEERATVTNCM